MSESSNKSIGQSGCHQADAVLVEDGAFVGLIAADRTLFFSRLQMLLHQNHVYVELLSQFCSGHTTLRLLDRVG